MEVNSSLTVHELSAVDLADVLRFSCGKEPWAVVVDRHFHEEAFERQQTGDSITYVVRGRDKAELRALASFALGSVSWPKPNSKAKSAAVIFLFFGIEKALRGSTTDGIRTSIACADLVILQALDMFPDCEMLCLYVDEENEPAIRLWTSYGFVEWGKRRQEDARAYIRMVATVDKVRSAISARRRAA